jgi:hypothetical protein
VERAHYSVSRLGCTDSEAPFCTSPPAPSILVATARIRRRLLPCAARPLASGVQVSAHRRLMGGNLIPCKRVYSAPQQVVPRRIASLAMNGGLAQAMQPMPGAERPTKSTLLASLERRAGWYPAGSLNVGSRHAGPPRSGSARRCGTSRGRRVPDGESARCTVAGLRQPVIRGGVEQSTGWVSPAVALPGRAELRPSAARPTTTQRCGGPSSSAAHAICFGEGGQRAVGPPARGAADRLAPSRIQSYARRHPIGTPTDCCQLTTSTLVRPPMGWRQRGAQAKAPPDLR